MGNDCDGKDTVTRSMDFLLCLFVLGIYLRKASLTLTINEQLFNMYKIL